MTLRARLLLTLVPLFVLCLAAADATVYADQQAFLFDQLKQQTATGCSEVESFIGGARAALRAPLPTTRVRSLGWCGVRCCRPAEPCSADLSFSVSPRTSSARPPTTRSYPRASPPS